MTDAKAQAKPGPPRRRSRQPSRRFRQLAGRFGELAGRFGWRTRTLRTRVTVVAGSALAAALMLGLVVLYLLQRQSARQSIDSQLRAYAAQIAQSARPSGIGEWPDPLPPFALDANAQAQVLGPDGTVLASTRLLAGSPAVYTLPAGATTPVRLKAADGVVPGDVSVVAVRTTIAGQPVTILTGTSDRLVEQVNKTFARTLLLGVPGILVLAVGTVWLVVGRALRPVERIRRAVTEITAEDLSRRVPDPGTRDEIGSLATTMNDMLGRLQDAALRQHRFVADASHELRSPLAAVRATLEVGLAHPDAAPWPALADRAVRQSARLEELVEQLLLLARAEDRPSHGGRRIDLGALVTEIVAETRTGALDVRLALAPDATMTGAPDHVARMLHNVLQNAARHARTTVVITTSVTPHTVSVEIEDDGCGIPVEDRERVFDRFVRLDPSREHRHGSSGLGLSIAREIAAAHDGRIAIGASTLGGADVLIELARTPGVPAPDPQTAAPRPAGA